MEIIDLEIFKNIKELNEKHGEYSFTYYETNILMRNDDYMAVFKYSLYAMVITYKKSSRKYEMYIADKETKKTYKIKTKYNDDGYNSNDIIDAIKDKHLKKYAEQQKEKIYIPPQMRKVNSNEPIVKVPCKTSPKSYKKTLLNSSSPSSKNNDNKNNRRSPTHNKKR